jgi:hypothetical protein
VSGGSIDEGDVYAEARRKQLKRFLPRNEQLIWTGAPQLSRLILRNMFRTGVMLLIASVGLYFLYKGITLTDVCGADSSKLCRKFYFWPWFGLVAAALYIPCLWLSFILHASGLLCELYGLTDSQAIKLRSNPFDRFQSAKIAGVSRNQHAVRKWFGSMAFGPIVFLSLRDDDIAHLIDISDGWQSISGRSIDGPDRQGSVP